ncbi:MAG: HAD-IA family hydrolase [Anaerolineae bacterium]|nr:HAD-IA family hydrolase [Anaerolineae bacterium]
MIDALIFDFDGLILNTEFTEYLSWQEVFLSFGVPFPLAVWQQNIGAITFDPFAYLETALGQQVDRANIEPQRRQRDQELLTQETILPGVMDYLQTAREMGLRIGLASSSPHRWVDAHLEQLGIASYFTAVACRDDVDNCPKPEPAVYHFVLAQLGVTAHRSLALEDSLNGVRAAKAAGVRVTAVPNNMTHSLDFSLADYRLPSLDAMPLSQLITEVFHAPN